MDMRIAVGCDSAGLQLKLAIIKHLEGKNYELVDFGLKPGEDTNYPLIAHAVAAKVGAGEFKRAMLFCGTGIGMAIVANKIPLVRAAVCHDAYSAQRARKSNNAQVITMGARVIGVELARTLTDIWLDSEFEGGRSVPKVAQIDNIDSRYRYQA